MSARDLQPILRSRFEGHQTVRFDHFMNMLISAVDGLAAMGVVLNVQAEGVVITTARDSPPEPVGSLDAAIKLVRGG